jgi:hypothetical protein
MTTPSDDSVAARRDPVEAQLEAYNAGSADDYVTCFTEDVIVEDGLGASVVSGREPMRERYRAMFASNPKLHCEVVSRVRVGAWVIDEERITGRSPTAEHVVAIYRVVDGFIVHVRFLR